jgi:hypothetical protein
MTNAQTEFQKADKRTYIYAGRETDRQTDRQTEGRRDRLNNRQTGDR